MKQIEGLTEESGNVYFDYNGQKINLTEIGDKCGTLHMTRAINILMEKTGIERKFASDLMWKCYSATPPSRAKLQEMREQSKIDGEEAKKSLKRFASGLKEVSTIRKEEAKSPVKCPRCGSASLSADKKGFGIGKAVVGAAVAGPAGLIAGNIGAKKVRITCLSCGNQFWAGKA